jgi:tellurite resistance protein
MSLLRFLGLGERGKGPPDAEEAETVRRIGERLELLDPAKARFIATFAYVLGRVANADLEIDADETREMETRVSEFAHSLTKSVLDEFPGGPLLSPEEIALVVEIAKNQNRLLGGTDNSAVTREFKNIATPKECLQLVTCLLAVAAADGTVSSTEDSEINAIADELGLEHQDVTALSSRVRDKIGALRGTPEP